MLIEKGARFNPKVDGLDPGLEMLTVWSSLVKSLGFSHVIDGDSLKFRYVYQLESTKVTLCFTRADCLKKRANIYEKFDFYVNDTRRVKNVTTSGVKIRSKIIALLRKYAPEILLK